MGVQHLATHELTSGQNLLSESKSLCHEAHVRHASHGISDFSAGLGTPRMAQPEVQSYPQEHFSIIMIIWRGTY